MESETEYTIKNLRDKADFYYENDNLFASPSSGSFILDAMIIVPCSMKTLSSIANGFCDNLISRSASCCLKEDRKLVITLRETPLDLSSINNMKKAKLGGAIILPAMPAFYYHPKNIDDIVNFITGKIADMTQNKIYNAKPLSKSQLDIYKRGGLLRK